MKTEDEITIIIQRAKQLNLESIEIDGVRYILGSPRKQRGQPVEEMKPEEMVKPLSVLDEYTDEEIQYWATPWFDILQETKEAQKNQKQIDDELKKSARG